MLAPVLISGAGPTGLTAALELSRLGIPVRVVDRKPEPADTSRAVGVQARTLELLHQRGLADELIRAGNPGRGGNICGNGRRLAHLDFSRLDSRHAMVLFVSQVETERVLTAAVTQQGVAIERGVEVVAIQQDALAPGPDPVGAVLRHPDGRLEAARASYLIAAEGAHSLARATLDLPFAGSTRHEAYTLGDLHMETTLDPAEFHIFAAETGFLAVFPLGGDHFRLIVSDPPGTANRSAPPTLALLQATFDARSHVPARLHDLTWGSWFAINSRMIDRMQAGRICFGGDSAHIHSPAGAQGMNTGIHDMINLGWKLAMVLKGQARPELLDTFTADRLPVIRNVLTTTERLTDAIGSENPIVRTLFNHLIPWVGGVDFIQGNAIHQMSQLAVDYRPSPLASNHPHPGDLHAGDRVPDLPARWRVGQGGAWRAGRLLDALDPSRFTLLATRPDVTAAVTIDFAAAVAPWDDRVGVVEVAPPADLAGRDPFLAVFGRAAAGYLARPDGYVGCAVGEAGAAHHLDAYLRRWLTGPVG